MFGIFALILAGLGIWIVFAPTVRFAQGFARLLESSKTTLLSINPFAPASSVVGSYKGRQVTLRLEHPREHEFGGIVLAMEVRAPDGAPWKDSSLTARNPDLSRATFDLEGRYELILTLRDGWLRADYSPLGRMFPGPFKEERWRNTLAQMHVLARWLEQRSA